MTIYVEVAYVGRVRASLVLWRRGKAEKAAGGAVSLAMAEQKLGEHSTESHRSVHSKDEGEPSIGFNRQWYVRAPWIEGR